jgi:hypothetical protein
MRRACRIAHSKTSCDYCLRVIDTGEEYFLDRDLYSCLGCFERLISTYYGNEIRFTGKTV